MTENGAPEEKSQKPDTLAFVLAAFLAILPPVLVFIIVLIVLALLLTR